MAIKNVIQENRIQMNSYSVDISPGVGNIMFVSVGALDDELDKTELPDRTMRSGGRGKPFEFDVVQPAHHDVEVALMEAWWADCQEPVAPDYLKILTYTKYDGRGSPRRQLVCNNAWISKKSESESDLNNEGDMATITWTIQVDGTI